MLFINPQTWTLVLLMKPSPLPEELVLATNAQHCKGPDCITNRGSMDCVCSHCGALMWIKERVVYSRDSVVQYHDGSLLRVDESKQFCDPITLCPFGFPLCKEVVSSLSSRHPQKLETTRRAGRYSFDAFYFYQRNAQATLASTMRDIINTNPELHGFKDFFFLTYTYGNKYRLDQQNYDQQLRLHFNDLNFDLFDLDNVFVDIGLQFARPGSTGLWTLNERTSPLLPLYFNIINRSNRYLRLDVFANNHNLGGCSYTTHRIEGNGRYNLMKAEFTLRYEDGIELLANAQHEAMQILSQQPPVMTVLSTTIVVDYLANMVNGYSALYQSLCNQADIMHEQIKA
ncbi:hypothetical protein EDC96DRAFT_609079 [Choanephora cucurbitarum]|nr:hypothetical protein EDC96DRAFT_609079 [Choanephora cucurbitarum]